MAGKNVRSRAAAQQRRPSSQEETSASGVSTPPHGPTSPQAGPQDMDVEALKLELLNSLRHDIAEIFKTELRAALGDDLSTIRADLQSVKIQLANDKAASDAELTSLKATVGEMEESLSACTDDVVELKIKFEHLAAEFSKLESKSGSFTKTKPSI